MTLGQIRCHGTIDRGLPPIDFYGERILLKLGIRIVEAVALRQIEILEG